VNEFDSINKKRSETRERSGPREIPIREMMENMHRESESQGKKSPKKFK